MICRRLKHTFDIPVCILIIYIKNIFPYNIHVIRLCCGRWKLLNQKYIQFELIFTNFGSENAHTEYDWLLLICFILGKWWLAITLQSIFNYGYHTYIVSLSNFVTKSKWKFVTLELNEWKLFSRCLCNICSCQILQNIRCIRWIEFEQNLINLFYL